MSAEHAPADHRPILEILPKDSEKPFRVQTTVMDEMTYQLVEMPALQEAIGSSITHTGSLTLERSLRQPLTSAAAITEKQEAVREVSSDDNLRTRLLGYLQELAAREPHLYTYYHGDYFTYGLLFVGGHPNLYDTYKGTRDFLQFLTQEAKKLDAKSSYLQRQIEAIRNFNGAEIYDWIVNPVFFSVLGLRNKQRAPWYLPKIRFYPTDLKPMRYLWPVPLMSACSLGLEYLSSLETGQPPDLSRALALTATTSPVFLFVAPLMAGLGRDLDDHLFVRPVGRKYFTDPNVISAVESLGAIDEIATLVKYGERLPPPIILPEVVDNAPHQFWALGLRNPLLGLENPDFVPNSVDLVDTRLTFLTGPNSGGKTTLCKTLAQTQVLAQIGSYLPAEAARISVADQVFYHAPMINSLEDPEGRFGTEVARIRDFFFRTTPRSLVILDELIEATTYKERLRHSYDILDGFWHIGNNTVLVTHNHELAATFNKEGRGQFLQVEFSEKTPTYKVVPGVSTESHSEEVLERLGFTREDILGHLKRHGYVK